jgi:dienelactone hydrolase
MRWFGGAGQRPSAHEVPLETFFAALDVLAPDCERLAILGTSFGAEAALVTASHDARVRAVVGFAPTAVVWGGSEEGRWASHWTLGGRAVPFVPFDQTWSPSDDPPRYRELYERSLTLDEAATAAATIPVERIDGDVLLVAGQDDQVWPSDDFASRIALRRRDHGLSTEVVLGADAGHRTVLPGESPPSGGVSMVRGGTLQADLSLGRVAWPHVASALRLRP